MINFAIHYNRKIRFLHSDGEKSLGSLFNTIIQEQRIVHEVTAPYSLEQNGLSERSGGVIIIKARAMALASNIPIPTKLWPETVAVAAYFINRTPTKALHFRTPYEALNSHQPSLSHFHVFGCKTYPLIQKIPRSEKLLPKAHVGYLVRYDSSNIFRIWIPSKNQVIRSKDVTFDDSSFFDPKVDDLGVQFNEAELYEVIQVLDDTLVRTIVTSQSIDEVIPSIDDSTPIPTPAICHNSHDIHSNLLYIVG